ncbi:MAG TPA: Crp/Fnr family transcriptional regulator [Cyclobacteriaceae bacterium]|nr:Crp/Fnr family transcriptional regulator [Cyclobacteriaceae bacterium]HRF32387.1 Crp/Fnr family transcriptional regulator [Cyclobacteriaceae bacterium]
MDAEQLFGILSDQLVLTDSFKTALQQEVTFLSLPKNHFLIEAPRPSDHIYLLQEGFAKGFVFEEGEKKVHSFWGAGDIIVNPHGCFEKVPSVEFVQLTEKSMVWCIGQTSLKVLMDSFKEARSLYRIVIGRYYVQSQSRLFDVQHRSAWQRYQKLIQQYPVIEQKVSQEYIASFLSITPQSLSRMKREHRNKP